ncbi:hypothetical protein GYMLUDRAFT_747933 [Collybiopsis luxurians FD-317 M1]|uniref:Uncharacterized protein n=1 Tax=Collybiopsis luxurians FD-317 M1 TaxID=944289 RepID=A0A0D0CQP4_9AGAR|nr:hypothetical protein GYMLUDRAFT_747933 [Collybiopsis luxurians FD-317 M1]
MANAARMPEYRGKISSSPPAFWLSSRVKQPLTFLVGILPQNLSSEYIKSIQATVRGILGFFGGIWFGGRVWIGR